MKKILHLWFLMMMLSACTYANPPQWFIYWNDAVQASALQGKPILMVFSGSDWCKPCMMLEKAVFEVPDFQEYAAQHLVLLKVDFPRKKKNSLSEAQSKHNASLAEKYNPEGEFPAILLLNDNGDLLSKVHTRYTTADEFIGYIQHLLTSQK